MFRKLVIALGATTLIAAGALAPTVASAKPIKFFPKYLNFKHPHWNHWHGGFGIGLYPDYADSGDCYIVRRVVLTKYGERIRREEVCD
jgi:hypothetical protein